MANTGLDFLMSQREKVLATAEQSGARNVRVFGSVARDDCEPTCDVDLLVDLDDGVSLVALAGLQRELTELLGVQVDVVPTSMLKPRLRYRVLDEAIPI